LVLRDRVYPVGVIHYYRSRWLPVENWNFLYIKIGILAKKQSKITENLHYSTDYLPMQVNLLNSLNKLQNFFDAFYCPHFLHQTKSWLLIFLVALPATLLAQTAEDPKKPAQTNEEDYKHHCFFEHQSVSIGLGAEYTTVFNVTGINAKVYYNLGEKFSLGPEFSYFRKEDEEIFDYNLVILHIFETPWVGLFPLVGGNYTQEKTPDKDKTAFGLVVGAGLHRNFNRFTLAVEYSRVFSDLPDEFITFGVMFNIK